ncbi:MAG: arylsulfatase [Bacteroidia bacterium]|nr:arylsulfatase [Bacteroidia bacterium]
MRLKLRKCEILGLSICALAGFHSCDAEAKNTGKPNVILILTDDQGFGDLGFYGNPIIRTPVLDRLAGESVRFNEFIVSPVSAPTRSALMTGRYSLRTGVRDTYKGGAIMASSEITIAEILKEAGYKTGMIGKWHLGDNYPFRPEDQGFDYTLRHLSGGIGQPGDWPNALKGDSSYFNPTLWQNGKMIKSHGYCTDVFTDAAINFVEKNKKTAFFLYLAFNAPHVPLQVPKEYYEMYKGIDPSKGFENDSRPFTEMNNSTKESARKVYAMVSNIDDNVGRLLNKLMQLNLDQNTLVIFMSDNGPEQNRYLAGMRGKKSFVYEGGVRVPCFWRYPSMFQGNRDINATASNSDILPTLAEICGGRIPTDRIMDGTSLLPLLMKKANDLPDRSLCRYWTRGYPKKFRNVSIRRGEYKLVGNCAATDGIEQFELFNMIQDPFELNNTVKNNAEKALNLKTEMENWLDEMMGSPDIINSPRAILGTRLEIPSFLNLNDAIYIKEKDSENDQVYWKVSFSEQGSYDIIVHFRQNIDSGCQVQLKIGLVEHTYNFEHTHSDFLKLENIEIPVGEADLFPKVFLKESDKSKYLMPFYLEVKKRI